MPVSRAESCVAGIPYRESAWAGKLGRASWHWYALKHGGTSEPGEGAEEYWDGNCMSKTQGHRSARVFGEERVEGTGELRYRKVGGGSKEAQVKYQGSP